MSGGIEAAGDVAVGTLLGRVVEPRAGDASYGVPRDICLNCGTGLVGNYCHACGQNGHVHKTLGSIGHDLAHGAFHFEGKIWRTLPMLVRHPGQLTRRYIDGERARFVSPLALFLFTVFLMFAVYSWIGPTDMSRGFVDGWNDAGAQIDQERQAAEQKLAKLQADRAAALKADTQTATIDRKIASAQGDIAAINRIDRSLRPNGANQIEVKSKWHWLDAGIQRARANPGLALYKVQSAAYKYSWALIVLSTPLIALLFLWRRRFTMYDHATFATYSISFMSLFAIAFGLASAMNVTPWIMFPLLILAPPAHMFAQLRGAYGLSIFSALWRTTLLLFIAMMVLLIFVVGIVALEVTH